MNAETILQSDILDILFDNRNKQYGAYELRKEYNSRLVKAIVTIISIVLLFLVGNLINNNRNQQTNIFFPLSTDTAVHLQKVDIPKDLRPPPASKPMPPVARVVNPVPVIAPDKEVKDTMHRVDDFAEKIISDKNVEGDLTTSDSQTDINQQPAQSKMAETIIEAEPEVIERPEIMPEFPGGTDALLRFLGRNLQVPEDVPEPDLKVKVPIRFVVTKDGIVSGVEFLTQADNVFRKEILRVIAKMPRWKPGSQQGKTVAVYYTIPVIFDMTEN